MDLDTLYQEIILDHYRNPHHKGLREPFEAEVVAVAETPARAAALYDETVAVINREGTGR